LATRRGGTSSLGATSAWTSTSSGREPSIVLDLDQAALGHLEDANLVGRAEAVLERAQRAIGALALALEGEHAVDQVLQHARPGE
jgi:hypothetical protein